MSERSFLYNGLNIRLPELAERCMQPAGLVHECDRLLGQTRNIVVRWRRQCPDQGYGNVITYIVLEQHEQHEQLIAKEKGSTLQKDHLYTL